MGADRMDNPVELYRRLPVTEDVSWWAELAADSPGGRVLYLGCGTGRLALPIAEACDELVAVDVDAAMLDAFRARLVEHPFLSDTVQLVEAPAQKLELGEEFGLVVMPSNLLNGITDPGERADALSAAARHCRPDGRVVLQVLNPFWMAQPTTGGAGRIVPDGDHAPIEVEIRGVRFDAWAQRQTATIRYRFEDGAVLDDQIDAIALFPRELRALTYRAGLEIIEQWGSVPGAQPVSTDGGTWHLVCHRTG